MQKSGGIVAIIPRGEVLRNFGFTGTFEKIARESSLSLLSVKTPRSCDSFFEKLGAEIFPLTEFPEPWLVRIQREMLDIAHGRWMWSRAAQNRWQTRDREAITVAEKAKRLGKKAVGIAMANKPGLNMLTLAERSTSKMLSSKEAYIKLYKSLKPGLVFNGSHIHSRNAIQAVQSAQWLGIPTATFVFSWDNLTSQGRVILPYDYFLVWNEALKTQLLELYDWIRPENVFVTGTPQFDFHFRPEFHMSREEFCESIGADPKRPIVFYSTGMAHHMPGEPEIVEEIADMLNEMETSVRPQLLVRVYPKDQTGRFDDLKKRRQDIIFPYVDWEPEWLTPKAEDSKALVNTLRHCAVGINVASTISLELCMFDKPTINVAYNPPSVPDAGAAYARYYEFDHYKPVVESGAIDLAKSPQEMREMLQANLQDPTTRTSEQKTSLGNVRRHTRRTIQHTRSGHTYKTCEIRWLMVNEQGNQFSISVVTPTLRRPGEVEGLLRNLSKQEHLPSEVILVDGAPVDEKATEEVVSGIRDTLPFSVVYLRHQGGTAVQRNVGVDAAQGQLIALVDDDVRLEQGFLTTMESVFSADQEKNLGGVVGYRTNQAFDPEDSHRWRWYKHLGLFSVYEPGRYDFKCGYPINNNLQSPFEGTREVDFMTTACAVWKREVFDSGLRFDSFFKDYGVLEDAHFSLMARSNWKLLQCGDAHCEELHSPNGRVSRKKLGYKCVVNYYFVFNDIVGPLSIGQKFRFWRFQLFELFRIGASAVRKGSRDDVLDLIGRAKGILTILFVGV